MRATYTWGWMLAGAVMAGVTLSPAGADTPAPSAGQPGGPTMGSVAPVSRDPVEISRFLGPVYRREVDGFQMMPPAGSRIIERSGVDLVSFVVDAKSWGGSVQRITLDKVMSLQDFVKTTKAEVTTGATFKAGQVLDERYLKKGPFPAARLAFSMQAELGPAIPAGIQAQMGVSPGKLAGNHAQGADEVVNLFRQELVARTRDNQFITLNMYAPLKDKDAATKTFEMMLSEFDLFDPAMMKQHRLQAIEAGKAWLAQQSAEVFITKMIHQPLFYRMLVGGKDVGYFRFDEGTKESDPKGGGGMVDVERDKHKGVVLEVNFRSFPDDATVVYGQNEAFWGYSKTPSGDPIYDYSSWTNIAKTRTLVPVPLNQQRPGQPTVQVVTPWQQETGVLIQIDKPHQMLVTLTGDATQRLPEGINQIIPAEAAAPLPKILEYTWTRFVDLDKPAEYTFVVFNSNTKKLANRTLVVTGEKENVTIDGKTETCYKCLDELDPNSTAIWTDKDGRIRMMRTSDQSVMIPTTEAAMATRWASRLKDQ